MPRQDAAGPTRGEGGLVLRYERFYRVVRRIPRGRVATYGQVAALAGAPRGARLAGYALSALRGTAHDVPWQRVLGARGRGCAGVSLKDPVGAGVQRDLLEREGVILDARGRIDLARFGWRPRGGPAAAARGAPGRRS
ncbi:MAG: MGMT family protein [Anaeromyxobacteraceae bacterium]|nr:MGMT family protein [Anaeromyxobacteraceae bacterium]